jgi:hypothetical protein
MTARSISNAKGLSTYVNCAGNFLKKNPGAQDRFMAESLGIFPNYEYALFGIQKKLIKHPKGGTFLVEFVELRCTHGPGYVWNGPTKHFNPRSGEIIDYKIPDADEGNLLIPIEEFMKVFENFTVCFYEENFVSTAMRTNEVPYSFVSYNIKVKKRGDYYFRLCQLSHYMIHPESHYTKIDYDKLTLLVTKRNDENEPEFLAGHCQKDRDVWVKLNLDVGMYTIFVSVYF